jgi:hypothetical protein
MGDRVRFSGTKYDKGNNNKHRNHYKSGAHRSKMLGWTPRPHVSTEALRMNADASSTSGDTHEFSISGVNEGIGEGFGFMVYGLVSASARACVHARLSALKYVCVYVRANK